MPRVCSSPKTTKLKYLKFGSEVEQIKKETFEILVQINITFITFSKYDAGISDGFAFLPVTPTAKHIIEKCYSH